MNYEFRKKYDKVKTYHFFPINQQEFIENEEIDFKIIQRDDCNFIDPKSIKFHFNMTKQAEQFPKQSLKQLIRGVRLTAPQKGFDFHKQLDDNLDVLSSINDFYFKGHQQTRTEVFENGNNDIIDWVSSQSKFLSNNVLLNQTSVKMYLDLSEIVPFFMSNQLIPIHYLEELRMRLFLNNTLRLFLNNNQGYDLEGVYISADFIKLDTKSTNYEFVNYIANKFPVIANKTNIQANLNIMCNRLTGFIMKSFETPNETNYFPVCDSINCFNENTTANAILDGKELYPQPVVGLRDFYNETKKYITNITNIKDYNSYYLYFTNMDLNSTDISFNEDEDNILASKTIFNFAFPINHEKVNNFKLNLNNLTSNPKLKEIVIFPRFISKIDVSNDKYIM